MKTLNDFRRKLERHATYPDRLVRVTITNNATLVRPPIAAPVDQVRRSDFAVQRASGGVWWVAFGASGQCSFTASTATQTSGARKVLVEFLESN